MEGVCESMGGVFVDLVFMGSDVLLATGDFRMFEVCCKLEGVE